MDTRWLRSFVEVVYHQSISRAAEHLGYTQQAVSQHVARLEQTLGATLLHRGPRGVTITAKGERVYFRAQSVLDEVDLMAQEVQAVEEVTAEITHRGRVLPLPPEARAPKQGSHVDISDGATRRHVPGKQGNSRSRNQPRSERSAGADVRNLASDGNASSSLQWNRRPRNN